MNDIVQSQNICEVINNLMLFDEITQFTYCDIQNTQYEISVNIEIR